MNFKMNFLVGACDVRSLEDVANEPGLGHTQMDGRVFMILLLIAIGPYHNKSIFVQ